MVSTEASDGKAPYLFDEGIKRLLSPINEECT